MQGSFGPGMQFLGQIQPLSQPGFMQNVQQEDYIALGEDEESYDPQYNPAIPSPPTTTVAPSEKNAAPPIDSQKKAAELRAKLLANRPQSAASGGSNTPSKSKELPIQTKTKLGGAPDVQSSSIKSSGNMTSTTEIRVSIGPENELRALEGFVLLQFFFKIVRSRLKSFQKRRC